MIGAIIVAIFGLIIIAWIIAIRLFKAEQRIEELIRGQRLQDMTNKRYDDAYANLGHLIRFANDRTVMLAQYISAEFHTEKEQRTPEKTGIRKVKKTNENK